MAATNSPAISSSVEATSEPTESPAKRGRSWVWEHVDFVAKTCKHCKQQLPCKDGNTTSITTHLRNKHGVCQPNARAPIHAPAAAIIDTFFLSKQKQQQLQDRVADVLARLVANNSLPLQLVTAPELKELLNLLREGSASLIPSRHALRALIPKMAEAHHQQLKNIHAPGIFSSQFPFSFHDLTIS